MKIQFTTLVLLVFVLTSNAQSTLLKLKFEEAERAYNEENYDQTLILLSELENEGLENPRILHLKILAKDKVIQSDITESSFNELKSLINFYLENYDIEGLEDKYKDIYEVSKTLEYLQAPLFKIEGDKYFNIDNKVALKYYLEADNAGLQDADMWVKISSIFQSDLGENHDNKHEAAKWLLKASEAGDPNSCVALGHQYKNGEGVTKDAEVAVKFFKTAAEKGHPEGQYEMGEAYLKGILVEADYQEALKWQILAADNKIFHERANYEMGSLFSSNPHLRKSYLKKVIEQGSIDYTENFYVARAMIFYVKYYGPTYRGIDLVPEIVKILTEGATTHNSSMAKFYLGLLYDNAFKECKIKKDSELARSYFYDAEKNVTSKIELGLIQFKIFMDLRAYGSLTDRTYYAMNSINNGHTETIHYLNHFAKYGDGIAIAILKKLGKDKKN